MQEKINETVEVMGSFKGGSVMPRVFKLKNKIFKIKKVHLSYQEREGKFINYYFSAETETGVYKLKFNNGSLVWEAEEVWIE